MSSYNVCVTALKLHGSQHRVKNGERVRISIRCKKMQRIMHFAVLCNKYLSLHSFNALIRIPESFGAAAGDLCFDLAERLIIQRFQSGLCA